MRTTIKATYIGGALLLALASGGAYASVDAGRVQFVFGNSQALAANGVERALKKGDVVHEGDTVITGPSASLQLLMVDKAIVAVRPNSRLRIDTYRYQGKEDGSERGVLHLIKGAFRSITGAIGHTNKKNYKIITDTANIGVRGTDHEPAYVLPSQAKVGDPGTYDLVNAGGTYITTPWGTVNVSPDQVGFASSEPGSVPVLLQGVPGFLQATPPMAKDADASGSDQPERVVGLGSDNPASLEEPWLNSNALSYLHEPSVVTTDLTLNDVNFNVAGVYGYVGSSSGTVQAGAFDANETPFEKFIAGTSRALAATDPASKLNYVRGPAPMVANSGGSAEIGDTVVNWGIYGTGTALAGHTVQDKNTAKGKPFQPDYMQVMGATATPDAIVNTLSATYDNVVASTGVITTSPLGSSVDVAGGVTAASISISGGKLSDYSVTATSGGTWTAGCSACGTLVAFKSSGVGLSNTSNPNISGTAFGQVVGPAGEGVISSYTITDSSTSTSVAGSFAVSTDN